MSEPIDNDEATEVLRQQVESLEKLRAQNEQIEEKRRLDTEKISLTRMDQIRMNAIGNAIALYQRGISAREEDFIGEIIDNADRILEFVLGSKKLN